MGWPSGGGGRRRSLSSNAALILLLLIFVVAALAGRCASASRVMRGGGGVTVAPQDEHTWDDPTASSTPGARRGLVGPGSSPPTCRSRCGGCRPCRPVHVAIQPGVSFPLEYYPEAWRCKCGNKLFMP